MPAVGVHQRIIAALALSWPGLRSWPRRRWIAAIVATGIAALIIGVPTGIVHTPFYSRMTAVTWWDYPIWTASAILMGLTTATYVRVPGPRPAATFGRSRRTLAATVLSTLAVGCPICNKVVVGLVGVSGALSYWAPLQPVLGILSLALLATGLAVRLQGAPVCAVPQGW